MRRIMLWGVLLAMALLFAGCISQTGETAGDLPWNTPPGWAGGGLGLPY